MNHASPITVTVAPIKDLDALGQAWADLQSRARHSFFTSWGWMKCWLACLPDDVRPQVLMAKSGDDIVGLSLLCRRLHCRHKVFVADGLFLNETGNEELDELTIEHNGLLVDSANAIDVSRACLTFLLEQHSDWDELHFSGIDEHDSLTELINEPPLGIECQLFKETTFETINLATLRESGAEYLSKLSSNTRQQVRRSMRLFEQAGPLEIDEPKSLAEVEQFYVEMKRLHQDYWQAKGHPGAFGSDFCDRFHRMLITELWPLGEIQLLRVRNGSATMGYLYNFLHEGRVLCYQSGFDYDEEGDPKRKPGMVSHVLAVQHNLKNGAAIYDFLGGTCRYKTSLSTDSEKMRWFVWQRPRLKFQVENLLRQARRKVLSMGRLA